MPWILNDELCLSCIWFQLYRRFCIQHNDEVWLSGIWFLLHRYLCIQHQRWSVPSWHLISSAPFFMQSTSTINCAFLAFDFFWTVIYASNINDELCLSGIWFQLHHYDELCTSGIWFLLHCHLCIQHQRWINCAFHFCYTVFYAALNVNDKLCLFAIWLPFCFRLTSKINAPYEQSLSKTYQKASKKGSAEIVPSLLSRRSPSFWASHSGQTGLGSLLIILTRRR